MPRLLRGCAGLGANGSIGRGIWRWSVFARPESTAAASGSVRYVDQRRPDAAGRMSQLLLAIGSSKALSAISASRWRTRWSSNRLISDTWPGPFNGLRRFRWAADADLRRPLKRHEIRQMSATGRDYDIIERAVPVARERPPGAPRLKTALTDRRVWGVSLVRREPRCRFQTTQNGSSTSMVWVGLGAFRYAHRYSAARSRAQTLSDGAAGGSCLPGSRINDPLEAFGDGLATTKGAALDLFRLGNGRADD